MATVALMCIFVSYVNAETILCDGGQTTSDCKAQTLSCASNETCIIYCKLHRSNATDYTVCRNSIIHCAPRHDCLIECDAGIEACRGLTINAHNATRLDVISKTESAFNLANIYCPTHGQCEFVSIPLHTPHAFEGLTILSNNGFNDRNIDFECTSFNCFDHVRMNCSTDFSQSCSINTQSHDPCNAQHDCGSPLLNPMFEVRNSDQCKGWEIAFTFALSSVYNVDEVQSVFTYAFIETILSDANNTWNDQKWCYTIYDVQSHNITFIANNALYSDVLTTNRTMNAFVDRMETYLIANISDFDAQSPVYTYAKYNKPLQMHEAHGDQEQVIVVSIMCFIAACVLGSIYSVHKCWAFEKTVDESDLTHEMFGSKKLKPKSASDTQQKQTTTDGTCTNHNNPESKNIECTPNNASSGEIVLKQSDSDLDIERKEQEVKSVKTGNEKRSSKHEAIMSQSEVSAAYGALSDDEPRKSHVPTKSEEDLLNELVADMTDSDHDKDFDLAKA
eukprot:97974_1